MKGYHDTKTPEVIRDLWQTPEFVFDYYDRRFEFDVDLAASESNALTGNFYSAEDSAFDVRDFGKHCGSFWCNPPYSDIMPWVDLCLRASSESGRVSVMLIPADTSVKWFKKAFDNCTECHFISGRISFINSETGKPVNGNNKGSVVFIFDPLSPVNRSVHLIDRDSMK